MKNKTLIRKHNGNGLRIPKTETLKCWWTFQTIPPLWNSPFYGALLAIYLFCILLVSVLVQDYNDWRVEMEMGGWRWESKMRDAVLIIDTRAFATPSRGIWGHLGWSRGRYYYQTFLLDQNMFSTQISKKCANSITMVFRNSVLVRFNKNNRWNFLES